MKEFSTDKIKNISVVGHGNSGKTSLVSAFLFNAGVTNRLTKVDEGNTVTDFEKEEKERKISIYTAPAYLEWKDYKVNILDTPGYGNFLHDAQAALESTEGALIMVDSAAGIEVQTEKVWSYASEYNVSRFIIINKMDKDNANFDSCVKSIQDIFGREAVPLQIPLGQESEFKGLIDLLKMKSYVYEKNGSGKYKEQDIPDEYKDVVEERRLELIEMIAEQDEKILEKYLEEGELSEEEIINGLKQGVKNFEIFPIGVASSELNIGINNILDTIVSVLPNPAEKGELKAKKDGEEITVNVDSSEPFSAFVFKTISDPYTGRINLVKIKSGKIKKDSEVINTNKENKEKIANIALMQGNNQTPIETANAGDIVAFIKLKYTQTSDTLASPDRPVIFDKIDFPEASISFALEPKTRQDEDKISDALSKIMEEDPTVRFKRDPQTKEMVISGNGQLHIEVIVSRLKKQFNVDVLLKPPKIAYLETIKTKADVEHKHKKQSGGRGQFAHVYIKFQPLKRGSGYKFEEEIFGGAIPKNYIPAVEKGIENARQKGILAGYETVDFKSVLYDGTFHEVDSSDMAFQIAASMAFKKAVKRAKPTILEPIVSVEIHAPEEQMGDIMGNLSGRRGKPMGTEQRGKMCKIKAQVPLAEMLDFEPSLTSITGGRGTFSMEFDHYEEVPAQLQSKIIEKAKKEGRIKSDEE